MTNLRDILQHYEKAEERFIRKAYNDFEEAKYNYIEKHLGFVNPNELEILKQLANLFEINLIVDGKYENSELKYVIAYNESMGYIPEANLCIYELKYNTKFNQLTHRQIMGTLFNAGVDTNLLGDIIVSDEGRVQIIISYELKEILLLTVHKYGNIKVTYEEIEEISINSIPMKRKVYSARSLRLDAICKMLSKVSRTKMAKVIEKGDVRVNFKVIVNTKHEITEGDLISIRGFGRYKIFKITKTNGKYNILYDEQT